MVDEQASEPVVAKASSLAVLDDLKVVAVGTAEGRVVCYSVDALLDSINHEQEPAPLYSFRAHEPGTSRKQGQKSKQFRNPFFCGCVYEPCVYEPAAATCNSFHSSGSPPPSSAAPPP